MKKIAAIICAYNEEGTIEEVVTKTSDYFFHEVIVVNDGSTDNTDSILKELKSNCHFEYIFIPENKGKGNAMAIGVEKANSEIIVFIDADLSNIQDDHFAKLIRPIFDNETDMVLGQATETLIDYKVNPFKSFTGERALLKKDILPILEDMKLSKFGVETLINLYFQAQEKRVKYVMLAGLVHPTKFEKTNQLQATKEFLFEWHQIVLTAFNNFKLITKIIKNNLNKL